MILDLIPAAEPSQGYLWSFFDVSTTTTKFLILSSLLFVIGVGGVWVAKRSLPRGPKSGPHSKVRKG